MPEESTVSKSELWKIQTNRSLARGMGGVGDVITSPKGDILKY